jgi:hypothetical protein
MEKKRIRLSRIMRLAARRYLSREKYDGKFTMLATSILWASHDCGVMETHKVFDALETKGVNTRQRVDDCFDLYHVLRRLSRLAIDQDWRVTVKVIK